MVGKVVEYPFDTVKVRLQSQPDHLPLRYSGPLDCFRQSLRSEGIYSLYRGISAPLFGAAIETSSLFFSYRIAQLALTRALDYGQDAVLPLGSLVACGAASGAVTSMLLTPIELVKCQLQVAQGSSVSKPTNILSVIASVYRHNGALGLWRGQLGTLIRETGGSAAWFGSYEGVCELFKRSNPNSESIAVWQKLLAGASAGMAYNFAFYPADTIKSRMQTEEVGHALQGKPRTFWSVGRALWYQHGARGLYRGCGITVARAAPSSAFIFVIYETLRDWAR